MLDEDNNNTYKKKDLDENPVCGANIQKNYIKEFLEGNETKEIENSLKITQTFTKRSDNFIKSNIHNHETNNKLK